MLFQPTDEDKIENQAKEERDFNVERFIKDVCNDRYILVIGSNAVLKKDGGFQKYDGDSYKYILDVLKQMANSHIEINSINDFVKQTADGETRIKNLFAKGRFKDTHDISDVSPELIALLNTRLFKFVMTTSFDDYVEILMRSIYGDKLRVVNYGDMEDWNKFQTEITRIKADKYDIPTLIYVFGKACVCDHPTSFVKNDNDAIRFIDNWMQETGLIIDYIRSKRVMALGCKFENWYFRFFWYILKRDFQHIGDGEVAISFDENDISDQRLKDYLKQNDVKVLEDARIFMKDVSEYVDTESNSPQSTSLYNYIKKRRQNGGIFLSYNSRNFPIALKLFFKLTEKGYAVWFDNDKLCGGYYEDIIAKAINTASAFIAVLSPEVATDFENNKTDNFYNKEWRIAAQLGKDQIIPLAVNGYSLRAQYHNTFKEVIALTDTKKISGFDLTVADDFNKLTKRIDELLTI